MSGIIRTTYSFITISFTTAAALVLTMFTPMAAFAAAPAAPAADNSACASSNPNGVSRPVGADASLYTCKVTGNWESDYFVFNPNTGVYSNLNEPTYTYNSTTGKYDYPVYVYDAPLNKYDTVINSTSTPPSGATVVGAPAPVVQSAAAPSSSSNSKTTPTTADQSIANTGTGSNNQISSDGSGGKATINGTGNGSNNTIASTGKDKLTGNYTTIATVNNAINSQANSGNAVALQNTTAGDVTSGNAVDVANVVNLLQSASSAFGRGGNAVTFVANINGDVNGDLLLNPANLSAIQPAGSKSSGNTDLTVNNSTNEAINNNLKLGATTGDATVQQNTTAGNATSGNALAVANIINIIDSAISSGKSFLGVININGNLNGDILLPPNFVNQLLAANVPTVSIDTTGANSNNTITNTGGNDTKINNNTVSGINNNVKVAAVSGAATSTKNTTAGSTTTGNAKTNITAFNLTGSNIIGGNDLLVFVNVLGTWVGLIVNAPAGANAAELGGGITQNVPTGTNSTTLNNNTNQQINNNVDVAAKSGNATETENTTAGSAKSGDAKAAVNLLNVAHSTISLSNWFGILFINVFGSWHGNFGLKSVANAVANSPAPANTFGSPIVASTVPAPNYRVFGFAPRTPSSASNSTASASTNTTGTHTEVVDAAQPEVVLGANTIKNVASPVVRKSSNNLYLKVSVFIAGIMIIYLITEAISGRRSKQA